MQALGCSRSRSRPAPLRADRLRLTWPSAQVSRRTASPDRSALLRIRVTLAGVGDVVEEFRPQGEGIGRLRSAGVDHQQHPVGFADGLERTLDADLLDLVVGVAQAGGVDHVQRHAVDVDMFAQQCRGWCRRCR